MMRSELLTVIYLVASVLFILSLSGLSAQKTAHRGNILGMIGMALAVAVTLLSRTDLKFALLLPLLIAGASIGIIVAKRVAMTEMPQLVAILHSFVGLAAVLVGLTSFLTQRSSLVQGATLTTHLIEIYVGVFIGSVTFMGSLIAWGKLRGSIGSTPLMIPQRHLVNLVLIALILILGIQFVRQPADGLIPLLLMVTLSLVIGWHMIMAIGGGDMPVVVSMLNSYSGWAAAAAGFMLSNDLLIVTGALVGSSGAILSHIMCRAMNRSFMSVILGGFGTANGASAATESVHGEVKTTTPEEVADLLRDGQRIVVVPGYGMAVAQAQYAIQQVAEILRAQNKEFVFGIHPVAGRLPGHMNVLLAEANVPYDIVLEIDEFNDDLCNTDVVLVIGANDIVNPSALEDPASLIYGMPVIEAWKAKTVIMLKRSMAAGYAGIDNPLCYKNNTLMLFGDAKKSIESILMQLQKRDE